jgi:hypothetical protein
MGKRVLPTSTKGRDNISVDDRMDYNTLRTSLHL